MLSGFLIGVANESNDSGQYCHRVLVMKNAYVPSNLYHSLFTKFLAKAV